jgi:hypothetical protein
MGYGPVAYLVMSSLDLVAPNAPAFTNCYQLDNSIYRLKLRLPVVDATGTALTGLTRLTIVSLAMTDEYSNPFEDLNMLDCLALPKVQKIDVAISPADAGTEKEVDVAIINLGGFQAFAAACADD